MEIIVESRRIPAKWYKFFDVMSITYDLGVTETGETAFCYRIQYVGDDEKICTVEFPENEYRIITV